MVKGGEGYGGADADVALYWGDTDLDWVLICRNELGVALHSQPLSDRDGADSF